MKRASALVTCFLFVCLMASASVVQAGGFALYEFSNRGVAMATTGYALAGDASVIATNPALMTELDGDNILAGAVVIAPQTTIVRNGSDYQTKGKKFVVPHAYYTRQMESNENVWLGVGMFTRFGLGTYYPDWWAGQADLQHVELKSVSLNPNIAFKFSEDFSVAVGVELLRGEMNIRQHPAAGTNNVQANTSGYSVGANLGLSYKFNDQWSAGFAWRSAMNMDTTGSGEFVNGSKTSTGQTIESKLPGSYTLGVGYKPTDDWNIEFDVIHTRWEVTDKMVYSGAINSTTELHYKNTWRFQVGTEYWAMDTLALRFGYAYDQTPTNAGDASYMLPANDRQLFSTGIGYKNNGFVVDACFMYVVTKERHNLSIGGAQVDFKDGKTWVTGLSAGYEF